MVFNFVISFENPFSQKDFPVMFTIRERMYFELHVDTEDRRLTIFALDCFATPSQDRNALPRYDVIKDGYVSRTYSSVTRRPSCSVSISEGYNYYTFSLCVFSDNVLLPLMA